MCLCSEEVGGILSTIMTDMKTASPQYVFLFHFTCRYHFSTSCSLNI